MEITWIQPYYDLILNEIPKNSKTILDVGAGYGILGFILKHTRPDAELTAIEPFDYDLSHYDYHDKKTWQESEFSDWKKFVNNKLDVIVSTECIEHMNTPDAMMFLKEAKKIAKKIIIATPYKFEQQKDYDNNKYQIHRSLITPKDFEQNGYLVKYYAVENWFLTRKLNISSRHYYKKKYHNIMKMIYYPKITNLVGIWESQKKE